MTARTLATIDGVRAYQGLEDGKIYHGTIQDVEPILELAKEELRTGRNTTGDIRKAATFPAAVVETYLNVHGVTFAEFLGDPIHARRMFQDPALADFRTGKM